MEYGTWVPFLAGGLGTLAMIWLANRGSGCPSVCRTGRFVQAVYLLGAIMFLGITGTLFVPNFYSPGLNDGLWLKPCFIGLSILFSWAFADSLVRKIRWNESGVEIQRLLPRIAKEYDWEDVIELKYRPIAQYWRVGFSDGTGFAVSEIMQGSHAFLLAFEENKRPV